MKWWWWPPRNWRLALLLRKIDRECGPPLQFLKAKTVYLEDPTTYCEGTALMELRKWGRFEVVDDRNKADLVLSFFIKQPKVSFSDWNDCDVSWLGNEARFSNLGYTFLSVSDPKAVGALYKTARVWERQRHATTREVIRDLRGTIKKAEAWHSSN